MTEERKRLEDELAEVRKTIRELEEVLNNQVKLNGLIKADLKYLMEKYGDARRTQTLIDAGVMDAKCIVVCTSDDLTNLDIALDARNT
jgi:DNA gyrase/topoisomerase IV subunit A